MTSERINCVYIGTEPCSFHVYTREYVKNYNQYVSTDDRKKVDRDEYVKTWAPVQIHHISDGALNFS